MKILGVIFRSRHSFSAVLKGLVPKQKNKSSCLTYRHSSGSHLLSKPISTSTLNKKMSEFIYPNKTPIYVLECEEAFKELNEKEKKYAHFLSKASWCGGLIVLVQTSIESPLIFNLFMKVFGTQSVAQLKEVALNQCSFTEDEYLAFLIYFGGVLFNMGNYKGFGDKKFVPYLDKDKFKNLILASKYAKASPQDVETLLSNCLDDIFSLTDIEKQLDFPSKGITTYLSKNVTEDDIEIINEFLKNNNTEAYNTRALKHTDETGKTEYEVRLASVLDTASDQARHVISPVCDKQNKIYMTRGDYSSLLNIVNRFLVEAKEHAANENEVEMLENYIEHFHTGSLDKHKDGSRFWIKDKGPVVESYIGFIENYRDPAGSRGEFEGFVAMVNKKLSMKFAELVKSAETFISLLPWPETYEKDSFLKPDFTSLDVLTFSGSGIPAGICIPNYNEIRQNEGFKNVVLDNVLQSKMKEPPNYVNKPDQELVMKYKTKSFTVQVGLHELLGHGSGKQFVEEKDGSFNFDSTKVTDFITNQKITSWYKEGGTYETVFGVISSSYEECRAESVALYLSDLQEVMKIFGHEVDSEDVIYIMWLTLCLAGLGGLEMYQPKQQKWGQAHCQARYVILQVLLEAGEDFVKVEETVGEDGKPDLLLTLDRTKIPTVGKAAIGNFLKKLQLYKSTANFAAAKEMYDRYSSVTSDSDVPFLKYREIVLARKKPRNFFVQLNTSMKDGKVNLVTYEPNAEGLIQSWLDRFQDIEGLSEMLDQLWAKNKLDFS